MPLLANLPLIVAADILEGIVPLIVLILWAIGQVLGKINEAKEKKPIKRVPRPQVQDAPGGGEGPPKEVALRNEVEDFLRRAQGKPPRDKQPMQKEAPRRLVETKPALSQPVASKTAMRHEEANNIDMRREGVAEHVKKHLNTQDIAVRVAALGDEVEQADEKLEEHLHEKFDHKLGSLQHQEQKVVKAQKTVASDIAEMLSKPEGMRQLIVANEILKRPEW